MIRTETEKTDGKAMTDKEFEEAMKPWYKFTAWTQQCLDNGTISAPAHDLLHIAWMGGYDARGIGKIAILASKGKVRKDAIEKLMDEEMVANRPDIVEKRAKTMERIRQGRSIA